MILDAVRWVKSRKDRPWLVLGKGPTFDRRGEVDLAAYRVLAINDTCAVVEADLVHLTDVAALGRVRDKILGAATVVMPWHPHVDHSPGEKTLFELAAGDELLSRLEAGGRLVSYNSTVARKLPKNPDLREIRVRYFSAVAAVNLLRAAGVAEIRTLGVDGGKEYASAFSHQTPLRNGRASFDDQGKEIRSKAKPLFKK